MRVLLCIVVLLAMPVYVAGQEYTVMFYNVENLFDTENDTIKNDEEFLPEGSRRWTATRYNRKLNAIARAVAASGEWDLPSLIGLCEVENMKVLKDLAYGTLLSAGNYGIVHRDSPDPRGIDLALLYRRDRFSVAEARSWLPESGDTIPVYTRNLLYVRIVAGDDSLHIIICHLPSRRGGMLAAEGLRSRVAQLVGEKVDSIQAHNNGMEPVIVMGDFNSSPEDLLMSGFEASGRLVNLAAEPAACGKGSYRYQGTWEMIDQVLVSPAISDSTCIWHVPRESFRAVEAPFLLTEDETYPGQKPFPTYGGYSYSGGYSDHLPVIVKLIQR